MAVTRIDLIDGALLEIGAEPVMSESAPEAMLPLAVYNSLVRFTLSVNPWHWNTVTRRLVRLSAPPERYWKYQFERPSDMLGAPRAYYDNAECRSPFVRVELMDGTIQSDAENLWMEMDKESAPATWPGYFLHLMQVALKSHFALSVREDRALHVELREQAFGTKSENYQGGLMGVALGQDAQGKPAAVLNMGSNPLLSARYER